MVGSGKGPFAPSGDGSVFIATMYSFGKDPVCVGVDGIVTCMGVFLAHGGMLYAIHVPFQASATNDLGREAFIAYVHREDPNFQGANAKLYGVTNNNARGTAVDEVRQYAKSLKVDYTVFCQLRENLGDKKSPDAAAVVCELLGGHGPVLKYQKHSTANWQAGPGVRRAGHYHNGSMADILAVPNTDVASGWQLVNAGNSDLKLL